MAFDYLLRSKALGMVALLWAAFAVPSAMAQLTDLDPDWKETAVATPPAFNVDKLIPLDMGVRTGLQFGVDPASISIGTDGVVRYVVVARNVTTGAFNALYEGLRCRTGEMKSYAYQTTAGRWNTVDNPEWRSLWDNQRSRHALVFARQGGCLDKSTPQSVADITQRLKYDRAELLR